MRFYRFLGVSKWQFSRLSPELIMCGNKQTYSATDKHNVLKATKWFQYTTLAFCFFIFTYACILLLHASIMLLCASISPYMFTYACIVFTLLAYTSNMLALCFFMFIYKRDNTLAICLSIVSYMLCYMLALRLHYACTMFHLVCIRQHLVPPCLHIPTLIVYLLIELCLLMLQSLIVYLLLAECLSSYVP